MEKLKIAFMQIDLSGSIENITIRLNTLAKYSLEWRPWPSYPYKPEVQFAIAHSNDCIFLKYFVTEKSVRGAVGKTNGEVWEDSCVEFFIAFDDQCYYNLEFNCIGTALVAFGQEKTKRIILPADLVEKIKRQTVITHNQKGVHWELTLAIPLDIFVHHSFTSFKGKQCRINFYKCGDALPEPHFLSWTNIESETPNFHLPQFFGDAQFE